MLRLCIILCCFTFFEIFANNSTDSGDRSVNEYQNNKTNGKTYLFQIRRNDNGDEPAYKIVNNYRENPNFDNYAPQAFIENNVHTQKNSPFENLKNRRRNYSRLERYRNAYSAHLVDPEWQFNINNQYIELPEIANEMYTLMDKNSEALENVSSIRFVFENYADEDNILEFNLEALESKTDEYIVDAELHIYRFSEINDTDAKEGTHPTDEVIRLYQILALNDTLQNATRNPDLHKLLNVIYVSSQYSGWQVFKVRNIVHNWLNREANLGFLLTATDSLENAIQLNIGRKYHGKSQPILIISLTKHEQRSTPLPIFIYKIVSNYFSAVSIPRLPMPSTKQIQEYMNLRFTNKLPMAPSGCGRQIWYVSFQELGWNNFIMAPDGFMSFQCRGSCAHPILSSTTNHAVLKHIFHSFVYVKKPCCVPDTYKALPIMFLDSNQNVVIKIYDDMIVDSCACR